MPTLVLGTAGHIDHGKSSLVEALTGTHPDRLAEEQRRGITIELGFTHTQIGDVQVSLVDVPGHERFVRTMVAGAAGIDAVLLVVAASESVMPQTREHLAICHLLDIKRGIVVVTKADLVSAEERDLLLEDVRTSLKGSVLEDALLIVTSVRSGEGLDQLQEAIVALATEVDHERRTGAMRLPIDRVFTVQGFGTVVTGTVSRGRLTMDTIVDLLPSGRTARVRGLQVAGRSVTEAAAPSRVAVNLGGVDRADVERGMTLASLAGLTVTTRVDVEVELLPGSPAVAHGARLQWLQGTSEATARVSIVATVAPGAEEWVPVSKGASRVGIPAGGRALARLRFDRPVAVAFLDRFVLRLPAPAGTIGGGRVLHPSPSSRGVRREGAASRLLSLARGDAAQAITIWAAERDTAGVTIGEVQARLASTADAVSALVEPAVASGALVRVDDTLLDGAVVQRAADQLAVRVDQYHRTHPGEAGLPRAEARGTLTPGIFQLLLERAGVIGSDRVARRGFTPVVHDADAALAARLFEILLNAGMQPPIVAELAALAAVGAPEATRALMALTKSGRVVKLGDLWFARDVLNDVVTGVRALGKGASVDIAAMKARYGVSRKFAVPVLEFLDRERVTRRMGDTRVVL